MPGKRPDDQCVRTRIGEVREQGADPLVWRGHLAGQLPRLVGAKLGIATEAIYAPDREPEMLGLVDVGWGTDRERGLFFEYLGEMGGGEIPYWPTFARLISSQHRFTRQRRQLVEDEPWYRSRHVNEFRRGSDVDDFIYSCFPVPRAGGWHHISVHRAWGDTPFDERQRWLVVLFHDELARLW